MLNEIWHLPVVSGGDIDIASGIGSLGLVNSQKGDGFEQGLVVLASILADDEVSDNQDGTLTEDVVFSFVGGNAKSFRGNDGFEFSVFVVGDLVISTVGQELSEGSLFSVVAFHLLSGIVVGESGVKEGEVSETDQESRGDDVFSISSIINQSVLFFQSVSGFHNSVETFVVDMEVNQVVLCVEGDGDSVKVELRVGRFSSNQRNSVQEGSIVGNNFSKSSIFIINLGNTWSIRKSHVSGFSSTRGQILLTWVSFLEQVLFLQALPAVIQ